MSDSNKELGQNLWTWMWCYKALQSLEEPQDENALLFDKLFDLDTEEPSEEAPEVSTEDTYGCTQEDMVELGVIHLYCTNRIAALIGEH